MKIPIKRPGAGANKLNEKAAISLDEQLREEQLRKEAEKAREEQLLADEVRQQLQAEEDRREQLRAEEEIERTREELFDCTGFPSVDPHDEQVERVREQQLAEAEEIKAEMARREEQLNNEQDSTGLPIADPYGEREDKISSPGGPVGTSGADQQKLRAERDDLFDRLARLQAEFDNYRKRSAKESADYRDYAVSDAAKALLPVMDSFNLALKNATAKPEDLRKGMELIYKQLQDVLQKINVERIPAQGELFDPRVHEAIEMVETDAAPDQHVFEELQPGYRIKGRLLRPAMVRVAKNSGKGNA